MSITGHQAYQDLVEIEAKLPDIALTLMGESVSICDDRHPMYEKIGHICDVQVSVTSCHLQVHLDDKSSEKIVSALEAGEDTKGHPWFQLNEVELIGPTDSAVH